MNSIKNLLLNLWRNFVYLLAGWGGEIKSFFIGLWDHFTAFLVNILSFVENVLMQIGKLVAGFIKHLWAFFKGFKTLWQMTGGTNTTPPQPQGPPPGPPPTTP